MLYSSRKAQVTLFVVIAVVAVAVISVFAMMRGGIIKAPMGTEDAKKLLASQTEPLRDYTSGCVKQVANNYFQEVMLHGGYYKYDRLKQINFLDNNNVILGFYSGKNRLPSLDSICGSAFDTYMEEEGYDKLDDCVKGFSSFKKYMTIDDSAERKIIAVYGDEDITVKAEWPIAISRADASSVVEQRDTKLLIPLGKMWTVANDILIYEANGNNFIDTEIGDYYNDNKYSLKNLRVRSDAYPTWEQTVFRIISVPYRTGEEENIFYFAIDRAELIL